MSQNTPAQLVQSLNSGALTYPTDGPGSGLWAFNAMIKYIKTLHNGIEVVAIFRYLGENYPLNEESLLNRISKMKLAGADVRQENKGLKFLRAHEKYVPPKK